MQDLSTRRARAVQAGVKQEGGMCGGWDVVTGRQAGRRAGVAGRGAEGTVRRGEREQERVKGKECEREGDRSRERGGRGCL